MVIQHLRNRKSFLEPRAMRGFTLLEMAMVLGIIGLIMGTILSMTKTLTTSSKISATQSKEALIKAALINFIAVNNRLPCPADPTGASLIPPNPLGSEALNPAYVYPAAKQCLQTMSLGGVYAGAVPWVTLGLTQDAATDGYNQFFTYLVAVTAIQTVPAASVISGLPAISGLKGAISIYASAATLTSPINNCTPTGSIYNPCSAVAVIISHGADGYGAYTSSGALNTPTTVFPDEQVNANRNYQIVMKDAAISSTNPFDDIILPMTSSDLLTPLSNNGTIQPYNAILNNDFANITAAIAANIALTHSGVPPTSIYSMTVGNNQAVISNLPKSIINDPWGNQIQYVAVSGVPDPTTFLCTTTTYSSGLFFLKSFGPDAAVSGVPITVPIYLNQLLPVLNGSGC